MFDSPLDFFSLLIAIIALIVARKAFNQVAGLRARLDSIEAASAATPPTAPPPTPLQEIEQTLATTSPGIAAEQPATSTESIMPAADGATATPPPLPAPPPADPGFEERIGTRWVVWIGGLTLALGGFFLVRYSIEAGLLGPGVRTILGGVFALALLASGEWTRRSESRSHIEVLPIANIPAILTAAGTAVAFATVYAAYALYDFLAPATAFVLLGLASPSVSGTSTSAEENANLLVSVARDITQDAVVANGSGAMSKTAALTANAEHDLLVGNPTRATSELAQAWQAAQHS